jgi:haloalkane dehalogenase
MPTLLLTTVFRPFGEENRFNKKGDEHLLDYLASRLTREPGLFALSSYVPNAGLHLIAANLPLDTRVLEWPTEDEFVLELKKAPDYVGISFLIKGFGKLARMIALTRRYAPQAKVIVGGFGTVLQQVSDLEPDYISTGEGVRFMRELLGVAVDQPFVHPAIAGDITLKIFQSYDFLARQRIGFITSGFGCPHACDFCSTSAYFGHRSVSFLKDGRQMYDAMKNQCRGSDGAIHNFLIYEEDFMLLKRKLEQMGDLIEKDNEDTLSYACFASLKSVCRHDLEKLVAQGLGHIWIGVESSAAPYEKRKGGDIRATFEHLHSLGVTTTGSIIFGLDHHTPENLVKEVDYLTSLRPSTAQISNLMAAKGTKLRQRLENEGRIREAGFKDADLYSEVIEHPNFRHGELTTAVFDGYVRLYEAIGPAIYRIFETWLTGYRNLRHSPSSALRRRSKLYAQRVQELVPLFLHTQEYLPNEHVRQQVANSLEEAIAELGAPTPSQQERAHLLAHIFAVENARRQHRVDSVIEPEPLVTDFTPLAVESNSVCRSNSLLPIEN